MAYLLAILPHEDNKEPFILQRRCHGHWWPGSHGISSNDIDPVLQESSDFSTRQVNPWTCAYTFYHRKNQKHHRLLKVILMYKIPSLQSISRLLMTWRHQWLDNIKKQHDLLPPRSELLTLYSFFKASRSLRCAWPSSINFCVPNTEKKFIFKPFLIHGDKSVVSFVLKIRWQLQIRQKLDNWMRKFVSIHEKIHQKFILGAEQM